MVGGLGDPQHKSDLSCGPTGEVDPFTFLSVRLLLVVICSQFSSLLFFLPTHHQAMGSQDYYTSHLSFAEGRNWWYWGFLFQMHRCLKSCMQSKLGKSGRILSTLQEIFNIMEPFTNNCLKKNPSKVPRSHNSFLYLYPSEDFYIMELSWSKAYFSVLMMSILSSSSSTIGWQDPRKCQK